MTRQASLSLFLLFQYEINEVMVFRPIRNCRKYTYYEITISVLKRMVWSNLRGVLNRRLLNTFPIILMGRVLITCLILLRNQEVND